MKPKNFLLMLAGAISALAELLDEDDSPSSTEGATTGEVRRRGRPPGSGSKPADTTPAAQQQQPAAPTVNPLGSKTYDEMRALIEPLVKEGKGQLVKDLVAKYTPEGLKGLPADKQAAFANDIAALSI